MSTLLTTTPTSPAMNEEVCLACSGGIPPGAQPAHITGCCARLLCSACVRGNPRLARYNPCLLCLSGPSALAASSGITRDVRGSSSPAICQASQPSTSSFIHQANTHGVSVDSGKSINLNGSLRDEDVFVVGDEDEDDDAEVKGIRNDAPSKCDNDRRDTLPCRSPDVQESVAKAKSRSPVHKIQKGDNLRSLAQKYGVEVRIIATQTFLFAPGCRSHMALFVLLAQRRSHYLVFISKHCDKCPRALKEC